MGPVHCSRDPQVRKNANIKLKLGPTALFTHLKIILLQCFQFSIISGIQIDPEGEAVKVYMRLNFFCLQNFFFYSKLKSHYRYLTNRKCLCGT